MQHPFERGADQCFFDLGKVRKYVRQLMRIRPVPPYRDRVVFGVGEFTDSFVSALGARCDIVFVGQVQEPSTSEFLLECSNFMSSSFLT